MRATLYIFVLFLFISCKNSNEVETQQTSQPNIYSLKYAKGFSVSEYDDYKVITITKPWPNAEKTYRFAVENSNAKVDFKANVFDGIIKSNINKIVVTSTTHIPSLELLGVEQKLVGFPGTDYISSEKTRTLINNGKIKELGNNEGINTEVLLELNPDIVVGFGVDGVNKTFESIKKANIPVLYHGGWVEESALGKAEWIKFFGVLFDKQREADSIFKLIESSYLEAKAIAKNAKSKPTVLSGAMTKDVWHLPNGKSPEAQFLKDANTNYLWQDTYGNGSLYLSIETVLEKAKTADLWMSPSYYRSLNQLEESNTLYTNFDAFKNKQVYSFSNTVGETGGVLYYELGAARPDLILKDLIKIAHPELLKDYTPYFFKALE